MWDEIGEHQTRLDWWAFRAALAFSAAIVIYLLWALMTLWT